MVLALGRGHCFLLGKLNFGSPDQNRVPDDLYYHGVQRERMAGFLEALKHRCEVVELDGGRDWRRDNVTRMSWYPLASPEFEAGWQAIGSSRWTLAWLTSAPTSVNVYGRKVLVPAASGTTCRFTFSDLCEEVSSSRHC